MVARGYCTRYHSVELLLLHGSLHPQNRFSVPIFAVKDPHVAYHNAVLFGIEKNILSSLLVITTLGQGH